MAAPMKGTCLKAQECVKTATEIMSTVVKCLKEDTANVHECTIEVHVHGHGYRPFGDYGKGAYRDLAIVVGDKTWSGIGKWDLGPIERTIRSIAKQKGIEIEDKGIYFGFGQFTPDCEFPGVFRTYGKTCKSFNELRKVVSRKCGINLTEKTLYSVRLFGKRSRYDESGRRHYYAYNEAECQSLLERVKSFGRKQIVCEVKTHDDIDTDYSIRYETECYGSREVTLEVTAKHPTKK